MLKKAILQILKRHKAFRNVMLSIYIVLLDNYIEFFCIQIYIALGERDSPYI